MARTGRVLYDGAIYHIVNRGHNRQGLFRERADYIKFKEIVKQYTDRYKFKLSHYCIMTNHFHMVMQIVNAKDLSLIMKGLTQTYVNYHKRKYHTVGYLFQGRYKSFVIEKDEYLLECARYIERNPLRAGIVTDLSRYPWSSYNYYAKGKQDAIISEDMMYSTFGRTEEERQKGYEDYVSKARLYEALLDKAVEKLI